MESTTLPQVEGGPASVQDAQKEIGVVDVQELFARVEEMEGVLAALIAYQITGTRPREGALSYILDWFEGIKSKYFG